MPMRRTVSSLLFLLFFSTGFFFIRHVSSAEESLSDKRDHLQEIIDKINAYKKISDLKERQHLNLSVQITSLETQAKTLEDDIARNESQLDSLEGELRVLGDRIAEKEVAIKEQKDILLDLFRSYYVDQPEEDASLFFSPIEVGSFLFSREASAQTGERISETLSNLEALKQSVTDEYAIVGKKKMSPHL